MDIIGTPLYPEICINFLRSGPSLLREIYTTSILPAHVEITALFSTAAHLLIVECLKIIFDMSKKSKISAFLWYITYHA